MDQQTGKRKRLDSDFDELFGPLYASKKARTDSTCPEEVDKYFLVSRISTTSSPLEWWARKEKQFPRLAKLAKTYLAVPATSTPSERIFSLAGNTILVFLNANQGRMNATVAEDSDFDDES